MYLEKTNKLGWIRIFGEITGTFAHFANILKNVSEMSIGRICNIISQTFSFRKISFNGILGRSLKKKKPFKTIRSEK